MNDERLTSLVNPMSVPLTEKQRMVLEFIHSSTQKHGYPPTLREIAAHFKFKAIGTVQSYLRALEDKGAISQAKDRARAIIVRQPEWNPLHIRILGRVAAGRPVLAPENFEGTLPCGELVNEPARTFALTVHGDSMVDAGILDGDYVLVHQQPTARNGDIVVARVGDEVTVKRFFREHGDVIRLVPENKAMEPLVYQPPVHLEIIGKVVGVYRAVG